MKSIVNFLRVFFSDFFYFILYKTMSSAHVHQPKSKSKGISIYDMRKGRMVHYSNPYGAKAKQAYKRYLSMPGSRTFWHLSPCTTTPT